MTRKKIALDILLLLVLLSQTAAAVTLVDLEKNSHLDDGFITIIYDDSEGKTYLKIDNLGEEFIYQTSLPSGLGSNDIGLDRGQLGDTRLAVFERAGNKLFLKQKPSKYRAITENQSESDAIDQAFASSILWGFTIEDSSADWVLVDASDFVLQDIHGVGRRLESIKQGNNYKVDATRSAIDLKWSKAFPDNTELQATITMVGNKPGKYLQETVPNPHVVSLKMHHSFIRQPDDGYQPRQYRAKSGYWSVQYRDYAQPINQNINQQFIARHRLQKKDPSLALSEPVKAIIYYIDPGVPEPVKSALIDGALWWNTAFEEIGYKDAFQVRILPDDADPMDVRYNVIQWVHRSTRGWSYGSSVVDPRTGEIIKGHVTLGSLRVRQDYLIAQGMMAPFSKDEDDQALMDLALARIRQLSAHEVGHTLGLRHNFAASNYGRESVMDYPHPLFELDTTITNKPRVIAPNAYGVGIGKWDKAAIAFGYQQFPDFKPGSEEENALLRAMLDQNDRNGLLYISDADARNPAGPHAYASLWDNGSDAVAELVRMLSIRKVALSNFGADNLKQGRNWSDLEEILVPVYYSHRYQVEAAAKWLGGMNYDYSAKGDQYGVKASSLSGEKQTKALKAILKTLDPDFLSLDSKIIELMVPKVAENVRTRESVHGNTGVSFDQIALASASAQHSLALMLNPLRLARIDQQNATNSEIPSIAYITEALHDSVIDQQYKGIKASIHQATVDLIYSNYLNLLNNAKTPQVVKAHILAALASEQDFLDSKLGKTKTGSAYQAFYNYQSQRLSELSSQPTDTLIELPKMPPGSPI